MYESTRRSVLDISCMWFCGLILPCSGVCHSDIVITYSNQEQFHSLCWLLIGLQCNDCVILMTQFMLIVIFMRCDDCFFFSLSLRDSMVQRFMSERVSLYVDADARVGKGNKSWSLCIAVLQFIPLCSWKASYMLATSFLWCGFSLFPSAIDMKRCVDLNLHLICRQVLQG